MEAVKTQDIGVNDLPWKIEYHAERCTMCGSCVAVCPQSCITGGEPPFVIRQEHCLHCGNCLRACPVGAVIRK